MTRLTTIHWFAPTLMLSAFAAGVLFAIGHHVYYQSLDGTPVSDAPYVLLGASISAQETAIAVGTALAFLVKSCLVLAIAVAAVQIFWSENKMRSARVQQTLERLDSAYSATNDFTVLFNWRTWGKFPLLMTLALVGWFIPIAAIITPATLSIFTERVLPPPRALSHVPSLDFRSLSFVDSLYSLFVNPRPDAGFGGGYYGPPSCPESLWYYGGPSHAVKAVANTVLASGSIVPVEPPQITNASWALQFEGPSITCSKAEANVIAQVQHNMAMLYHDSTSLIRYGYLAWTRSANSSDFAPFRSSNATSSIIGSYLKFTWTPGRQLDHSLFIGVFPKLFSWKIPWSDITTSDVGDNIYQCNFHNATYHVHFNYTGSIQKVHIDSIARRNAKSVKVIRHTFGPDAECMSPQPQSSSCNLCNWNEFPFRDLSYQAVVEAFVEIVKGKVYSQDSGQYMETKVTTVIDTAMMDTVLKKASDLSFLEDPESYGNSESMAYEWMQRKGNLLPELQGLISHPKEDDDMPLGEMLERVFANYTVSLMSSPALQYNQSSLTAPPPVNVTSHKFHNVYSYSKWKLWVPYGIAILLTLLAVCTGMSAIVISGASYSQNFSTIFRAAKGAQTSLPELTEQDLDWKDPLPNRLGKATIYLRTSGRGESTGVLYKPVQKSDSGDWSSLSGSTKTPQVDLRRTPTRVTL